MLERQPWHVKGYMLVLKKGSARLSWHEINLDSVPIWVQIHGLPLDRLNELTPKYIVDAIGEVLEIQGKVEKKVWCVPFIRVRVLLNTLLPIPAGYNPDRAPGELIRISFKYERLSGFCYFCGYLSHMQANCTKKEEGKHLQSPLGHG